MRVETSVCGTNLTVIVDNLYFFPSLEEVQRLLSPLISTHQQRPSNNYMMKATHTVEIRYVYINVRTCICVVLSHYRSHSNYPNILIAGTAYLIILFLTNSLNIQFSIYLAVLFNQT